MAHPCHCRSLTWILAYWLVGAPLLWGQDKAALEQGTARVIANQLAVTGKVLLPNGMPAAHATIVIAKYDDDPFITARADQDGTFQLQGIFGSGARIHTSSADGLYQMTLMVPANAARRTFAVPLKLVLVPATRHEVTVLSEGKPVKGAHVAATGACFKVRGQTDNDGRVLIHLPANARLRTIVGWDPQKGLAGTNLLDRLTPLNQTTLALRTPAQHTVRVIDADWKPVAGLMLGASVRTGDSAWIMAGEDIAESHFRTDSEGTARLPWFPRENLRYVDFSMIGSDWKVEDIDISSIDQRLTTAHVRRETNPRRPVAGRVIMPEGQSAEGMLITGRELSGGSRPYARVRRDGTFVLRVLPDYACTLGISDLDWASDLWAGIVLNGKTGTSAKISLVATPASPITVRVTRGPDHVPVTDAWVEASTPAEVKWIDSAGNTSSSTSGVFVWLLTDAKGMAQTSGRLGPHLARLSLVNWNERQQFEVTAKVPHLVEFHRAWLANRRITGQLTVDGAPYQPSRSVVAYAWAARSGESIEPVVHRDGTYEVAFDDDHASLLFIDREKRRSAFVKISPTDSTVDLTMRAMAAFRGTLLDDDGQPMADRTLQLSVTDTSHEAASPQQTDSAGRFRFEAVPANVSLKLRLGRDSDSYQNLIDNDDRQFKPGKEVNDVVIRLAPTKP